MLIVALAAGACDDSAKKPAVDAAVEGKAKQEAEFKARMDARKKEREAKEAAKKQDAEALEAKIQEITVIPDGTKLPKKPAQACEQVVSAQEGFMKKFHGDVPANALATQLGMLRKQCNSMKDVKVAMCQKFALEATTDQTKGAINDYLPACMEKYGSKG